MAKPYITRPTFDEAAQFFQRLLQQRNLPRDLLWVFDENLCFEKDPPSASGYRLHFQRTLTPPPQDAERITYKYFAAFEAPIVFYRLGSAGAKSVCMLLCDQWFETRKTRDEMIRKDEWAIQFRPGGPETLEEISDENRWKNRMLRDRPLHEVDFSMSLRSVHELLAHGRVLSAYEHYALRLLHVWRKMFGEQ